MKITMRKTTKDTITITITKRLHSDLEELGDKGDSFDDVIRMLYVSFKRKVK